MNAGTVRSSMRLPLLIVLLTLMSPCDRLWAQTDPFLGNWRFVPEESSRFLYRETVPKDIKNRFVVENGTLREEFEIILPDGTFPPSTSVYPFHQFDGKEHPYSGTADMKHRKHTILSKRIDDHTIERRINHDDGTLITTDRLVISPDGRKLTQTRVQHPSDGTPSETVLIFVRQ
jgi:hypothetical protein